MPPEPFLDLLPSRYGLSEALGTDIATLDGLLGELVREQAGGEIADLARTLVHDPFGASVDLSDPHKVLLTAKALTLLFQLTNVAEQKEIVRVNRARRPRSESIRDAVGQLKAKGFTAAQVRDLLHRVHVEPTFTAHPTEAKRRAILDKLKSVAVLLDGVSQPPPLEAPLDTDDACLRQLRRTLLTLWQTDEMRESRLTVEEEVRNAVYFLSGTVMKVVPWLRADLRDALAEHFPGEDFPEETVLSYRTWVGGDRDGNPEVTPEVTWKALLLYREAALERYVAMTEGLRRELTSSTKMTRVTPELLESLARDEAELPFREETLRRYAQEPYVRKALAAEMRLGQNLAETRNLIATGRRGHFPGGYPDPDAFLTDLDLIMSSLRAGDAAPVADEGDLRALRDAVATFGFHLATLDVRQHSDEHQKAVDELLTAAGVLSAGAYTAMSEAEKTRVLTRELTNPRPLVPVGYELSESAARAVEVMRVVKRARDWFGAATIRAYVISMTHGVSDILEPMLLAKEVGLAGRLDIVPLFETIDDLHAADGLMRAVFAEPTYQAHLQARGGRQEIMLGYSDSSKDGGFLAANWALQGTLDRVHRLQEETGVPIRLFHGRGGTVGRGGGRANRAILSQPAGSFGGEIRFTEQGEVISFRYGLAPIAHRHLEQILSAALLAAAGVGAAPGAEETYRPIMERLEETSKAAYRKLVYDDPEFWPFYTQATPIEYIALLPIASRPVFRPGKALSGIEGLRAIPWNFAWVQNRATLVGWYGLGTALKEFSETPGGRETLQKMHREWPFFQTVMANAQLELARAELTTARRYAERVEPPALGDRIMTLIEEEHARSVRAVCEVAGIPRLLEGAKTVRATIQLRNPAVAPLNRLQLALMDAWPNLDEEQQSGVWREAMLQTIAGLAAAMQSTG